MNDHGSERGKSNRWQDLYHLMRLLWRATPIALASQAVLYLLQGVIPPVGALLNKLTLDLLVQVVGGNHLLVHSALLFVLLGFGLTMAGYVVGIGLSGLEQYLAEQFSLVVESLVLEKTQRLPLMFFDQPDTYDKLQRARNGFAERGVQVTASAMRIGATLVTIGSFLALLASVHWGLAMALLPAFILSLLLNVYWGQQRFRLNRLQTTGQREISYLGQLLSNSEAAKEIRLFGIGPYIMELWRSNFVSLRGQRLTLNLKQNGARLAIAFVMVFTSLGASLWLFFRLVDADLSVGTYVAIGGAVVSAIGLVPQLTQSFSQLYENALFTSELFRFLALPDEQHSGDLPFPTPLRQGITVEGLHFQYPGATDPTLKEVSFHIKPGERVAIVGENGAGKTTLVKCLLGLYPPTKGAIQYDGVDLRYLDQRDMRSRVSAVFQDFIRYALTPRENVGFGDVARIHDTQVLEAAARASGADAMVQALSNQWDTRLGRMWDGGQELSYGQWQRLATARALIRDAEVVVLDEPTSALDPKAEAALFAQFADVTRGKTSFIISHRLGIARLADRVLVLRAGVLVEEGTHDELLNRRGEYARMFATQAQWYV